MINRYQVVVLTLVLFLAVPASSQCGPSDQQFLISFHPHLDAFWLNTDDELKDINFTPAGFLYAMNQRNSKTILNSMYQALTKDQSRKYFVTEVFFFKDWYEYLSPDKQKQVKKLIQNGQLQIPNGGWVENDQAVCYMDDILDQYTIGSVFLHRQFGVQTKIGWATDCFGHSHSQVALQHLLGYQFQQIQRIDDRYIYDRQGGSLLQFYWSPVSDSNNQKYGGVVTLVRHFLHQVNDLRRTSAGQISRDFFELQENMQKLYHIPKHYRFLGNDFEEFITSEFQVLEQSIKEMNTKSDKNCPKYKYGNPSDYLLKIKNVYNQGNTQIRQNDFMPNYDQDHYWTGYYTTNPELKIICKDFSRLTNLYRKIYIQNINDGAPSNPVFKNILIQADQLLSILQHHDGITATSKYHIQQKMKERMRNKAVDMIKVISMIKRTAYQTSCPLYQGNGKCKITANQEQIYFTILHYGVPKRQRIEITLGQGLAYDIIGNDEDQIFCLPENKECSIVFQADILNGQNVFILYRTDASKKLQPSFKQSSSSNNGFSVAIQGSYITYTMSDSSFIKIGLVKASSNPSNTQTYTWDKYGNKRNKYQNRMAGLYIMSNDGKIKQYSQNQFHAHYITQGKVFTKIYAMSYSKNNVFITIKNSAKNIIDVQTYFKPQGRQMNDYFIQIESNIHSQNEFYHDMNGYLVSKRVIGQRPDYRWQYKPEDKINANTYPMCSFAYAIQDNKKLVMFTDRAQGFTQYGESYLINIDRIASDDYKGAGEGYFFQIQNIFRHRIGLVNKNEFPERQWQRNYDQALLGFITTEPRTTNILQSVVSQNTPYFKYTAYYVSQSQYLLRFYNLAEDRIMKIGKYGKDSWKIPQLGLNLKYADIKETFANGLPLSQRRLWKTIQGEVNIFNGASRDTVEQLMFRPLQIRTFRINKTGLVIQTSKTKGPSPLNIPRQNIKPLVSTFKKRCF